MGRGKLDDMLQRETETTVSTNFLRYKIVTTFYLVGWHWSVAQEIQWKIVDRSTQTFICVYKTKLFEFRSQASALFVLLCFGIRKEN